MTELLTTTASALIKLDSGGFSKTFSLSFIRVFILVNFLEDGIVNILQIGRESFIKIGKGLNSVLSIGDKHFIVFSRRHEQING